MKKFVTLLLIIATGLFLPSCQKEFSTVMPDLVKSNKVKTYTETVTSSTNGNSNITYNLSYDANNTLISLVSAAAKIKILYTFLTNNKYTMDFYQNDTLNIHEDFYNNASLFIDSTFQYNINPDTSSEKYLYNNLNQVVQMNEYNFSNGNALLANSIAYTYDITGDLITATGTDKNTDTYTYYTDSSYVMPLIIGPVNSSSTQKVHLAKTYTLTSNGTLVVSANYTYTFDASNRITSEEQTYSDGNILLRSYTYF